MNNTGPFIGFIVLTVIYFVLYFFLAESSNTVRTALISVYWILVVATQYGFALINSAQLCGKAQVGTAFLASVTPRVIVFGSTIALLQTFPSWKAPFSNTIGYLIVRMLGVKDMLNNVMKPASGATGPTAKMLEDIYEDQSILINSMTPANFKQRIEDLRPLMRQGADVSSLERMVVIKDEISRAIWYLMSGFIATSMTMTQLVGAECVRDKTQMAQLHQDWETKLAMNAAKESEKPRIYNVRE